MRGLCNHISTWMWKIAFSHSLMYFQCCTHYGCNNLLGQKSRLLTRVKPDCNVTFERKCLEVCLLLLLLFIYFFPSLSLLSAWARKHRALPWLVSGGFGHLLAAPHQPCGRSYFCQLAQLHRDRSWEKHVIRRHPPTVPSPRYARCHYSWASN